MDAVYYAIEAKDLNYLKDLKKRVYSEKRLTADDMRDIGNRLDHLIHNAVPLDNDGNPTP